MNICTKYRFHILRFPPSINNEYSWSNSAPETEQFKEISERPTLPRDAMRGNSWWAPLLKLMNMIFTCSANFSLFHLEVKPPATLALPSCYIMSNLVSNRCPYWQVFLKTTVMFVLVFVLGASSVPSQQFIHTWLKPYCGVLHALQISAWGSLFPQVLSHFPKTYQ